MRLTLMKTLQDDEVVRRRQPSFEDDGRVRIDCEEDLEDDDDLLLQSSRFEASIAAVEASTAGAMRFYSCCFWFHAACCEAPLAAIEAACRAACCLTVAAACCSRSAARESAISGALALSLGLVPALLPCCAYAEFDACAEAWSLRPVPTCLGRTDPRRLCTVAFGQGGDAANVADDTTSLDTWPGGMFYPPLAISSRLEAALRCTSEDRREESPRPEA